MSLESFRHPIQDVHGGDLDYFDLGEGHKTSFVHIGSDRPKFLYVVLAGGPSQSLSPAQLDHMMPTFDPKTEAIIAAEQVGVLPGEFPDVLGIDGNDTNRMLSILQKTIELHDRETIDVLDAGSWSGGPAIRAVQRYPESIKHLHLRNPHLGSKYTYERSFKESLQNPDFLDRFLGTMVDVETIGPKFSPDQPYRQIIAGLYETILGYTSGDPVKIEAAKEAAARLGMRQLGLAKYFRTDNPDALFLYGALYDAGLRQMSGAAILDLQTISLSPNDPHKFMREAAIPLHFAAHQNFPDQAPDPFEAEADLSDVEVDIVTGLLDMNVPRSESEDAFHILKRAGAKARLHKVRFGSHSYYDQHVQAKMRENYARLFAQRD